MVKIIVGGNMLSEPFNDIVIPVNTEGVMGAGLAKAFKTVYPLTFTTYRNLCLSKRLKVNNTIRLSTQGVRYAVMFPTKKEWRKPSKMSYLVNGLVDVKEKYREKGMVEVGWPVLGGGLGGLDREKVLRTMLEELDSWININYVYITTEDLAVLTSTRWFKKLNIELLDWELRKYKP